MAHKVYENVILSNKINDILTTQVNLNNYMTVDTSLAEGAGMKKVINTYTSTGSVEEVAMGAGNTTEIEVTFTPAEYEVKTYQGKFAFYDEQEMQDPMVVDTGLQHSADNMVNTFTSLAVAEFEKATIKHTADTSHFGLSYFSLLIFDKINCTTNISTSNITYDKIPNPIPLVIE
jgi:hypothetical protein